MIPRYGIVGIEFQSTFQLGLGFSVVAEFF